MSLNRPGHIEMGTPLIIIAILAGVALSSGGDALHAWIRWTLIVVAAAAGVFGVILLATPPWPNVELDDVEASDPNGHS